MNYATEAQLIARFGQGEVAQLKSMHSDGELAVYNALADATNQINSYLSVRYHTPVNSEYLTVIACNIARYRLWIFDPIDEVETRYKEDIAYLKDVANGKANLVGAKLLTADELASLSVKRATPQGNSYKGQIFGDDVFDRMVSP